MPRAGIVAKPLHLVIWAREGAGHGGQGKGENTSLTHVSSEGGVRWWYWTGRGSLIWKKPQLKISLEKHEEKNKNKTYLGPKRHALCRLGPFSLLPPTLTLLMLSKHRKNLEIISYFFFIMNKKKTRTYGPNDAKHVVWAHCSCHHPTQSSSYFQNIDRI